MVHSKSENLLGGLPFALCILPGAPYAGYACGDFDFAFLSVRHRNPSVPRRTRPPTPRTGHPPHHCTFSSLMKVVYPLIVPVCRKYSRKLRATRQGTEGKSIPGFQNSKKVGEIKDTKTVSNTKQLRIQKEAAQNSQRKHELITGQNTHVTKNAAEGTTVVRRHDLGPKKN